MNNKIVLHTVKDLKHILDQYPDDLPVLISGYENGYENFFTPEKPLPVKHFPENKYYDGEFQIEHEGDENFKALLLERVMRDD